MRNPSRIYPLLNKIGDIWVKNPDLRFCQLIEIIIGEEKVNDMFFYEDEKFEKLIDKYKEKFKPSNSK